MCMDWLRWRYNHAADVTALAVVTQMTEAYKSTAPNAIREKKWWNTINIEEILEVISRLEKAEQTADICDNARFTPNSVVPSTVAL